LALSHEAGMPPEAVKLAVAAWLDGAVVAEEVAALDAEAVALAGASDVAALLGASDVAATLVVSAAAGPEAAEADVLDEHPVAAAATNAPQASNAMRWKAFTAGRRATRVGCCLRRRQRRAQLRRAAVVRPPHQQSVSWRFVSCRLVSSPACRSTAAR
jgi:hypothetical protein